MQKDTHSYKWMQMDISGRYPISMLDFPDGTSMAAVSGDASSFDLVRLDLLLQQCWRPNLRFLLNQLGVN